MVSVGSNPAADRYMSVIFFCADFFPFFFLISAKGVSINYVDDFQTAPTPFLDLWPQAWKNLAYSAKFSPGAKVFEGLGIYFLSPVQAQSWHNPGLVHVYFLRLDPSPENIECAECPTIFITLMGIGIYFGR